MKKLLLFAAAALLTTAPAFAQFRYTFTTQNGQAYTPLTTGTDLTGGAIWDDNDYSAPLGFTFVLNGKSITSFNLTMAAQSIPFISASTNFSDSINAFFPLLTDFVDRSYYDTSATAGRSPIRYVVDGSTPNRVFKAEIFNAGFFGDTTGVDSVNLQVWMYEGSNAVEFRYGPSRLTPANLPNHFFFGNGTGPAVGLANGIDPNSGAGTFYTLTGAPTAPTLDSFQITSSTAPSLNAYPASGTVYRFTPTTTGTSISEAVAAARALKLYPSVATTAINVAWSGAEGEAYQIVSTTGQQVAAGRLQRGAQSIAVGGLTVGTYSLRVAGGGHMFVKQ